MLPSNKLVGRGNGEGNGTYLHTSQAPAKTGRYLTYVEQRREGGGEKERGGREKRKGGGKRGGDGRNPTSCQP